MMPSALRAEITSAEVCGPRPGGYTVSNRRFRRAAKVVLIDMTSNCAGVVDCCRDGFAAHSRTVSFGDQVQTLADLPSTLLTVARFFYPTSLQPIRWGVHGINETLRLSAEFGPRAGGAAAGFFCAAHIEGIAPGRSTATGRQPVPIQTGHLLSAKRRSGGEQHSEYRGVGMADRIDAYAADHRRNRAIGFRFHPGRTML